MKKESLIFQEFCSKIVTSLQDEDINVFHNIQDDECRIRFLFKHGTVSFNKKSIGKNLDLAQKEKEQGNSFYSKKDLKNAIGCYSKGILLCPQDTASSKELLSVLVANRTAVLFEMKRIDETLSDIEYALENDHYPKHLSHKLYLRKGKCLIMQNNKEAAISALHKAEETLDAANLKESVLRDRKKEISEALKAAQNINTIKIIKTATSTEAQFPRNSKYTNAHALVDFEEDEYQGRYAKAKGDIPVGTVIIEEKPFCSVIQTEYALSNCQNCARSVKLPIACPNCVQIVFCSVPCKNEAIKMFHNRECKILPELFESKASVNCAMALRMITSRDLSFFEKCRALNGNYPSENSDLQRFQHVCGLCRHERMRKPGDFMLYTAMAIFLLKLLKKSDYFGDISENELTDIEAYVGSLILRFLQILQFNAHEISELQPEVEVHQGEAVQINSTNDKSVYIGGALYPTLALFNHSCDPSIVRYNIGNKIIVRLIKNVKKGEIIYENYGPMYTTEPKEKRQKYLQERYWFTCRCIPCEEDWPLFDEMSSFTFRIPCKTNTCKNYITADDSMDPFKNCSSCGAMNTSTIMTALKKLQDVDGSLNTAEEHFKNEEYEKAIPHFLSALKIYHAHTIPPFPDYVKVQQRLRTCMVHLGNKCNTFLKEEFY